MTTTKRTGTAIHYSQDWGYFCWTENINDGARTRRCLTTEVANAWVAKGVAYFA